MEHDTNAAGSAEWGQDSVGIRSEKPKLLMPVRCTTRKFHVHHPPLGSKRLARAVHAANFRRYSAWYSVAQARKDRGHKAYWSTDRLNQMGQRRLLSQERNIKVKALEVSRR